MGSIAKGFSLEVVAENRTVEEATNCVQEYTRAWRSVPGQTALPWRYIRRLFEVETDGTWAYLFMKDDGRTIVGGIIMLDSSEIDDERDTAASPLVGWDVHQVEGGVVQFPAASHWCRSCCEKRFPNLRGLIDRGACQEDEMLNGMEFTVCPSHAYDVDESERCDDCGRKLLDQLHDEGAGVRSKPANEVSVVLGSCGGPVVANRT